MPHWWVICLQPVKDVLLSNVQRCLLANRVGLRMGTGEDMISARVDQPPTRRQRLADGLRVTIAKPIRDALDLVEG